MALVRDPASLPVSVLVELKRSLLSDLAETRELVENPQGKVLDPGSLDTAADLLGSAAARLAGPGPETPESLAADINLAYAAMLAAIDLVKSHTDMPRVPRRRTGP